MNAPITANATTGIAANFPVLSLFAGFWQPRPLQYVDRYLLIAVVALVSVGLLMIMLPITNTVMPFSLLNATSCIC